ncbi:MAG: hypothetical protein CM15mP83_0310 [Flavobacteriaceae bacterium]|nr:MAG: hypothetical protein CM15mP83_0310 [Flavobacteriaceae bacterium]
MRVAVVGVTGMVGEIMRNVLEERNFPITEFFLSLRCVRKVKQLPFKEKTTL